jgi:hypothetical protein
MGTLIDSENEKCQLFQHGWNFCEGQYCTFIDTVLRKLRMNNRFMEKVNLGYHMFQPPQCRHTFQPPFIPMLGLVQNRHQERKFTLIVLEMISSLRICSDSFIIIIKPEDNFHIF